MAINLEIIEFSNLGRQPGDARMPVPEAPWNALTNVAAAGATALTDGTTVVKLRNRAGGDSVYALVQLASSSEQASADDALLIAAGEEFDFALPKGATASDYEVDVRAIV